MFDILALFKWLASKNVLDDSGDIMSQLVFPEFIFTTFCGFGSHIR